MAGVDLSLKPTLAGYPFREQPEDKQPVRPLHTAQDGDDALLAMVDTQGEIAALKIKIGEVRQAVKILHQAYSMIEAYIETFPRTDPIPPAACLAAATVRLALCSVLSSMGRHTQALHEAKMGAVEMDKVWRTVFLASAEQETATADGDTQRPSPPLRDALRNPPRWIERAVEVAVQARHCVALELEYEAQAGRVQDEVPAPGPPLKEGEVPDPVPISQSLTVQEQIGKLHREGVQLSRQLLHGKHEVRGRAERALEEWLQRTGGDGQPNLAPSDQPLSPRTMSRRKMVGKITAGVPLDSPELQRAPMPAPLPLSKSRSGTLGFSASMPKLGSTDSDLPALCRKGARSRLPPPGTWPGESIQTTTASLGSMEPSTSIELSESRLLRSQSVATYISQLSYASAPAGEVYVASLPKRSLPEIGRSGSPEEGRRKASKERAVTESAGGPTRACQNKSASQRAKEAAILAAQKDPFEDWRRNMVNENQMSYFQRKLRSDRGLELLQSEMRDQAKHFKNFWLRELPDHALFDNRTKFCPSGMKATKIAEKRMQTFKDENWEIPPSGTNHKLFQDFGSPVHGENPTLKDMHKMMQKSHTHGANLEKMAREEERRQKKRMAEERAAKLKKLDGCAKVSPRKRGKSPEKNESPTAKQRDKSATDKSMTKGSTKG